MSRVKAWTVGRQPGCDLVLDDRSVSRRHAEVVFLPDGRLHLTDRATTNGTFVLEGNNWRPLRQAILRPTDRIRLGHYTMTVGDLSAWCERQGKSFAEPSADRSSRNRAWNRDQQSRPPPRTTWET